MIFFNLNLVVANGQFLLTLLGALLQNLDQIAANADGNQDEKMEIDWSNIKKTNPPSITRQSLT